MTALLAHLPLAAAWGAVALGLIVLVPAPRRPVNQAFGAGMLVFALHEFCRFRALAAPGLEEAFPWVARAMAAAALLPLPWILFGLLFTEPQPRARLRAAAPYLVLAALVGVLSVAGALDGRLFRPVGAVPDGARGLALTGLGTLAYAAMIAGLVGVLVLLESTLRNAGGLDRWRVKFIVIGLGAALAAQIFGMSQALLYGAPRGREAPVESAGFLIAFAVLAIGQVRFRLFLVDLHIARPTMYRTITLTLVGGYLVLLGLGSEAVRRFGFTLGDFVTWTFTFAGAVALAVLLVSEQARDRLKLFVDRHIYEDKYDYRQRWMDFTRSLGPVVRVEEALPRLVAMLLETMRVRRAAVFLREPGGGDLVLAHGSGCHRESARIPAGAGGEPALGGGEVVARDGAREAVGEVMGELGLDLLGPMEGPEGVIGAIGIGPVLDRRPHGVEDRELLATVAGQAAATILTARLSQDLAVTKQLDALHRVAAFLLHDLKNCAATLTMLAANARTHIGSPEFQRDALEAISSTAQKMRHLIARISALPAGPETIRRVPVDLAPVASGALEEIRAGLPQRIALRADTRPAPGVVGDPWQIGRVVTNLVMNAVEAVSGGGEVSVETFLDGRWACLRVADTGPGIPEAKLKGGLFEPFRSGKQGGLGIGLYQCKSIAEAHGGRIEVESGRGAGSRFTVRLPAGDEGGGAPDAAGREAGAQADAAASPGEAASPAGEAR